MITLEADDLSSGVLLTGANALLTSVTTQPDVGDGTDVAIAADIITTGSGAGAELQVTIVNGAVTAVTVAGDGSNYAAGDTLTITAGDLVSAGFAANLAYCAFADLDSDNLADPCVAADFDDGGACCPGLPISCVVVHRVLMCVLGGASRSCSAPRLLLDSSHAQ